MHGQDRAVSYVMNRLGKAPGGSGLKDGQDVDVAGREDHSLSD